VAKRYVFGMFKRFNASVTTIDMCKDNNLKGVLIKYSDRSHIDGPLVEENADQAALE